MTRPRLTAGVPEGSLVTAVRRGVSWKLASLAANQAIRLVTLVLFARALSPRDFGLAAIALAVWSAASAFTDLSLAAALVQLPEIDEADRSTAFWASAFSGLALALVGLALSGTVARIFGEPDVRWLFATLGLGAFVASLASPQIALLTRAMNFRTLELISVSAGAVGAGVAIALALAGAGAWAIVANALVVSVVTCGLAWRLGAWRPQPLFSRQSLGRLAGFASLLTATRLVVAVQRTADRILIGRFLGAPALGVYAVPASIVFIPAARLVDPIRTVLFPAFSKLQRSPQELAHVWLRVTRLVCALLAPFLLLLVLASDEVIEVALTDLWSRAAPILQILALAGLFQLAGAMNAVVLAALDRLDVVLRVFCVGAALSIAGFAIGQRYGLRGATAGYAFGAAAVVPYYVFATARELRLGAREVSSAYLPAAAGLIVMAVGVIAAEFVTGGAAPFVRLLADVLVGFGLYAAVVFWGSSGIRSDLEVVTRRGQREPRLDEP